jgi:hypothetical protein
MGKVLPQKRDLYFHRIAGAHRQTALCAGRNCAVMILIIVTMIDVISARIRKSLI